MQHVALILVEGETEEEFYSLLEQHCRSCPKKIKNLHGNFNINTKIVDEAVKFSNNNPGKTFDVYVCIDQERPEYPPYNHSACESTLKSCGNFRSLNPIIAYLMCESIFFLDIEGIYKFLKTPKARRKSGNYKNFRKLTHRDLSHLFKMFDKEYRKGKRCANFVAHLDTQKLLRAEELSRLVTTIHARIKAQP